MAAHRTISDAWRWYYRRSLGEMKKEFEWVSSLSADRGRGEQGERASVEGMGCTLDEELLNSPVRYCALFGSA
ncbi:MAG: hypothetical protein CXX71_03320 [Methanobacteriota archaeon]|nr:MAG: hypothetical protein CXX71_03320 [Euryarchaeota archaeon]